jgi:hypothetical protein
VAPITGRRTPALVSLPWGAHGFELVGFNTSGGQFTTYAVDYFLSAVTH